MAVSSLKFRAGEHATEDKHGYIQYSGAPHEFHHWKFRTELKMMSAGDEKDRTKTVARIVENLRGEALTVAMDVGLDALTADGGITTLIDRVREHIFPIRRDEAKALYREGHKVPGVFSRQPGETMQGS